MPDMKALDTALATVLETCRETDGNLLLVFRDKEDRPLMLLFATAGREDAEIAEKALDAAFPKQELEEGECALEVVIGAPDEE